ncbi:helix-turn-helix domain-containing protein [Virgibacillus sp. LDC-1]|uniref:helix-turn-helix domain-containing protein n=1 Tax=Virgibacillus sp. LDC-1 TaxID=3039856 RepID=UPI0024DE7995|nr:helix-turn-helix domain-containing protein [Virgibacillus sp. LDC-1]
MAKVMRNLLSISNINLTILAGEDGLDRPVETIDYWNPKSSFTDKHAILLLQTSDNNQQPIDLTKEIVQLNMLECAGLVIQSNERISQDTLERADLIDFPIISLPDAVSMHAIKQYLISELWGSKLAFTGDTIAFQTRLMSFLRKETCIKLIIDDLAALMNSPIYLYNPFGNSSFSAQFSSSGLLPAVYEIEKTFHDVQANNARANQSFIRKQLDWNNQPVTLELCLIHTTQPLPYMLAVVDSNEQEFQISSFIRSILHQLLVEKEAVEQHERLSKNNFFTAVVDGSIRTREEIVSRGDIYGLLDDRKYACIVCQVDADKKQSPHIIESNLNHLAYYFYDLFGNALHAHHIEHFIFRKNAYFVTVLQFPLKFNPKLKETILQLINQFQRKVEQELQLSISFGISNFINDIAHLSITFREAVDALLAGLSLNQKQYVGFYKPKELKELLKMIPSDSFLDFYEETLRSLAFPKSKEETDLVNTLHVYLDQNCEITETSKLLGVHRNTVKYRIAKCEEILQYNIQEPDYSLRLRTALLMKHLFTDKPRNH